MHPSEGGGRRAICHEERRHVPPLEFVDHLSESAVQRRLACQANGDVCGMPGLEELLAWDVRIPFEAAQEFSLRANRILDDQTGIVSERKRIGAPFLGPPAKLAREVASIDRRGHLEAPVTLDAVEGLLVTPDSLRQTGLRPVTQLHAAVLPDDPVALAL